MGHRLNRTALVMVVFVAGHNAVAGADSSAASLLQRFLAIDATVPHQYRALRHFEARTTKLAKSAWMDVWTDADATGFRFNVIAEGGSDYIRSKVFIEALETEQKMWRDGTATRGAITHDNYLFVDCATDSAELTCFTLKPRRNEVMLVDGSIFLHPETGDLVRMEGALSKNPSFWTRRVNILRRYERIAGIRMPVAFESTANVRMAGLSTFTITYDYESVNGTRVGSPVAAFKSQVASR